MTRKIDRKAARAFLDRRPFRKGNTEVQVKDDTVIMYLHGNPVARDRGSFVHMRWCGWVTVTTAARLNGIADEIQERFKAEPVRFFRRSWEGYVWFPARNESIYTQTGSGLPEDNLIYDKGTQEYVVMQADW